jgi:hypothetical protein
MTTTIVDGLREYLAYLGFQMFCLNTEPTAKVTKTVQREAKELETLLTVKYDKFKVSVR